MTKSPARGAPISADVEVLALTPHALWLAVGKREFMLDFERFPWFRDASMRQAQDLVLMHGCHLHWPALDVDLHLDSLAEPERFPLVSRGRGLPPKDKGRVVRSAPAKRRAPGRRDAPR